MEERTSLGISNNTQQVTQLINYAQRNQFGEAIEILQENNSLPLFDIIDKNNNSVLHFICFHDNNDAFDIIMQNIQFMLDTKQTTIDQLKEHLLAKNDDDYSPFHLAVYKGNLKMIERMMKYELDIYTRARRGLTVLHLAAQGNFPHVLHYFIQKGIPIDIKNQNGGSALHYASFSKSAESLMYLLSKGSEVNLRDNQGVTPIYLAALQSDNTYIANKLLKKGANPFIKNNQGQDAIQAAENKNNADMVKLLKKKDGLIEMMNIKTAQKPVTCKLLPLILYFLFYFTITFSTLLFNVPYVKDGIWIIILYILLSISFGSFLLSWLVNPGYITSTRQTTNLEYQLKCLQQNNDDHDICYDCIILRPHRSKHCEYCQRCIQVYDHHCPWINNCVGARNFLYFQIFIISTFLYSLFTIILTASHMTLTKYGQYGIQFNDEKVQLLLHKASSILCIVVGILVCLMLLMLIRVQLANIKSGLTTQERINGIHKKKKVSNNKTIQINSEEQSNFSDAQSSTEDEENTIQKKLVQQSDNSDSQSERQQLQKEQQPTISCLVGAKQLCFQNKNNQSYQDYSL